MTFGIFHCNYLFLNMYGLAVHIVNIQKRISLIKALDASQRSNERFMGSTEVLLCGSVSITGGTLVCFFVGTPSSFHNVEP